MKKYEGQDKARTIKEKINKIKKKKEEKDEGRKF